MASQQIEDDIIAMVKQANDRNEPIGKKDIYDRNFLAIRAANRLLRRMIAEGKLIEHMVSLPHGTTCLLMVPVDGAAPDATKQQKMIDMTLYCSMAAEEKMDRIIVQNARIEKLLKEIKGELKT